MNRPKIKSKPANKLPSDSTNKLTPNEIEELKKMLENRKHETTQPKEDRH
jgi:hypothetical protein